MKSVKDFRKYIIFLLMLSFPVLIILALPLPTDEIHNKMYLRFENSISQSLDTLRVEDVSYRDKFKMRLRENGLPGFLDVRNNQQPKLWDQEGLFTDTLLRKVEDDLRNHESGTKTIYGDKIYYTNQLEDLIDEILKGYNKEFASNTGQNNRFWYFYLDYPDFSELIDSINTLPSDSNAFSSFEAGRIKKKIIDLGDKEQIIYATLYLGDHFFHSPETYFAFTNCIDQACTIAEMPDSGIQSNSKIIFHNIFDVLSAPLNLSKVSNNKRRDCYSIIAHHCVEHLELVRGLNAYLRIINTATNPIIIGDTYQEMAQLFERLSVIRCYEIAEYLYQMSSQSYQVNSSELKIQQVKILEANTLSRMLLISSPNDFSYKFYFRLLTLFDNVHQVYQRKKALNSEDFYLNQAFGNYFSTTGILKDLEIAKHYYQIALISVLQKDPEDYDQNTIEALYDLAIIESKLNDSTRAFKYMKLASRFRIEQNDYNNNLKGNYYKAIIYYNLGMFEDGLAEVYKGFDYEDSINYHTNNGLLLAGKLNTAMFSRTNDSSYLTYADNYNNNYQNFINNSNNEIYDLKTLLENNNYGRFNNYQKYNTKELDDKKVQIQNVQNKLTIREEELQRKTKEIKKMNETIRLREDSLKLINDKVTQLSRTDSITQLQVAKAFKDKKKSESERNAAITIRNWAIIIVIGVIVLAIALFYIIYYFAKNKYNKMVDVSKKEEHEAKKNLAIIREEKERLQKITYQSNTRAGISQLFARTDSHDLGHVLDAYKSINDFGFDEEKDGQYQSKGDMPKELKSKFAIHEIKKTDDNKEVEAAKAKFNIYLNLMGYFNQYLKTRMDFRADVATGDPNSLTTLDFYNDVFMPFNNNLIFNNRISGISDKELHYEIVNSSNVYGLPNINENMKLPVAIPNDVLGCHALYIIWSNVIRNTVKHGKLSEEEKKKMELHSHIEEYAENMDFYVVSLFTNIYRDETVMNEVVEKRNKAFDDKIFKEPEDSKEAPRLRDNNLGSIEMAACAAYLRKMNVNDVDDATFDLFMNDKYMDGKPYINPETGEIVPMIMYAYANKTNAPIGKSSLGYKFYLLKPKEILIICDNPEELSKGNFVENLDRKLLANYGVDFHSYNEIGNITYNHKFLAFIGNEEELIKFNDNQKTHLATLPKRKVVIDKDKKFKNLDELNKECWNSWLAGKQNINIFDYENQDNLVFPAVEAPDTRQVVLYNHHTSLNPDNFVNGTYHEMICGHHWLKNSRLEFRSGNFEYIYPYLESVATKVLIIDERIQKNIVLNKKMYADTIPFDKYFEQLGIIIPGTNPEEPDLNMTNLKESRQLLKTYIRGKIKTVDFIVLHLGILEKLLEEDIEKNKGIDKEINDLIGDTKYRSKVVVTTGRGKAANVKNDISFVPISLLQNAIETTFDKYRLVQILYNSRKSI